MDALLRKYNLKYDDLNPMERETLNQWLGALQQGNISIDSIRKYIGSMRDAVEQELTQTELGKDKDMFLKARLRNYMLLEAMLGGPEKAKEGLERAVAGIANGVG